MTWCQIYELNKCMNYTLIIDWIIEAQMQTISHREMQILYDFYPNMSQIFSTIERWFFTWFLSFNGLSHTYIIEQTPNDDSIVQCIYIVFGEFHTVERTLNKVHTYCWRTTSHRTYANKHSSTVSHTQTISFLCKMQCYRCGRSTRETII